MNGIALLALILGSLGLLLSILGAWCALSTCRALERRIYYLENPNALPEHER